MKKKNFLALLASVMIMAVWPSTAVYGQNTSGFLNADISWRIENGTLYISGKGVVPTTMLGAKSDWYNSRSLFHSVVIEDGITFVGQNVFVGYKNLTSLKVAGSVTELSLSAFNSCKKLSLVEVKGATPPDIALATFYGVKLNKAKLIVPAGTKANYQADPLWNQFGTIEESAQPPDQIPSPVKSLAQPCTIHLRRTSNFFGGGVSVRVFLNGEEQPKLSNASTVTMQTDRDKNMLYIQQGKKNPVAARRFDATEGGEIKIEFSYFNGYMKIINGNDDE